MMAEDEAAPEATVEAPHADKTADQLREELVRSNAENAGRRHEIERLEARIQKMERDSETEQERRDRETEERIRAEVAVGYEQRLIVKDVEAKAGPVFADPADAVAQLEHSGALAGLLEIDDPAKRDQAVAKALEELLQAKPYLGRGQQNHRPLVSQGARTEQTGRPQVPGGWLRGR
jgi:chromosome segregation ATPase